MLRNVLPFVSPAPRLARMVVAAVVLTMVSAMAPVIAAEPAVEAVAIGIRGEGAAGAVPGSYLVKLRDTEALRRLGVAERAGSLAQTYRGTLGQVWRRAATGFHVTMSRDDALRLAAEPDVEAVLQDQYLASLDIREPAGGRSGPVETSGSQTPVHWSLDRIDQHALPLDNRYNFDDSAGQNVRVYVISSGIEAAHPEFGGRVAGGPSFVPDGRPSTTDCNGAGTAEAGLIGSATHGVAKSVTMVSVRVANCNGIITNSAFVSGFDWVIANHVAPAVILFNVLSYCLNPQTLEPVECDPGTADLVVNAQETAFVAGITVVGGAGDDAQDACDKATGAAPDTIFVGGTTSGDALLSVSNFGPCVTMYAPGEVVTTSISGTEPVSSSGAASCLLAGAAALFAGKPEFAGATPAQIRDELVRNRSTPNVITGLTANSKNLLLFTGPPGFFTIGDSASLASYRDGSLELFGANGNGRLLYREQGSPGGLWTPWSHSITSGWLSVGGESNADGRMALAGVTPSGEIWLREQIVPGVNTYSNWVRLSGAPGPIGRAVMARNASNQLQIFATTHQGQIFYRSQLSPGSRQWSGWTQLSFSGKLRSIAAVNRADGRVELFGVNDAGQAWRAAQTNSAGTTWTAFSRLNGFGVTAIAAARNASGNLELFGLDAGGGVWRRRESSAGVWPDWSAMPAKTLARVTAEIRADGRVQLVGVDNLSNLWQTSQTTPGSATYTAWMPMDGQLRP